MRERRLELMCPPVRAVPLEVILLGPHEALAGAATGAEQPVAVEDPQMVHLRPKHGQTWMVGAVRFHEPAAVRFREPAAAFVRGFGFGVRVRD